ncbi:hypothetical protein CPB84DRAFT_1742000 [Gymnopilus junonius]|uniref:Uncharacterized protein n=1 Tax=Gymnopilus junonius TaxID=109634 RepID=A0A9P5TUH2_GYMJU|nr:hypothetical protein CPB84DRAFT_1742000 [Gymnopilus junonius]
MTTTTSILKWMPKVGCGRYFNQLLRNFSDLMLVATIAEDGNVWRADDTVECAECRKRTSRGEVELVYMNERDRWDRLFEVAHAWDAFDIQGEGETSEEEAEEDFLIDNAETYAQFLQVCFCFLHRFDHYSSDKPEVSSAVGTKASEDVQSEVASVIDEDNQNKSPSPPPKPSFSQSPTKVKRKIIQQLAERTRSKRRR